MHTIMGNIFEIHMNGKKKKTMNFTYIIFKLAVCSSAASQVCRVQYSVETETLLSWKSSLHKAEDYCAKAFKGRKKVF